MEGAAFFMAFNQTNCYVIQLRSISNYVEKRNKEKWNMPLAIKNLNDCLHKVILEINDQLI
jgi:futalosine hydrolase